MKGLKKLLKGFEKAMTASAFAEEGEFETAREIIREAEEEVKKVARKKDITSTTDFAVPAGQSK